MSIKSARNAAMGTSSTKSMRVIGGNIGGNTPDEISEINGLMAALALKADILDFRTRLTANETLYVDGLNGNDSIGEGTLASPYATPQRCFNHILAAIDPAGFDVTMQVADGTYSSGTNGNVLIITGIPNIGNLFIKGNAAHPENVLFNATYDCVTVLGFNNINKSDTGNYLDSYIQGFKFQAVRCGIYLDCASDFGISDIDFGTCTQHIRTTRASTLKIIGNYKISGSASMHYYASSSGYITPKSWQNTGIIVTLSNTPAFALGFAYSEFGGWIDFGGVNPITFTGAATGIRYTAQLKGCISSNPDSPTFFPGSVNGTCITGGCYNNREFRTKITASTTIYVRPDGSDSNDGSADDAAHAFLTLNKARLYYATLDCFGKTITIKLADGTYTDSMNISNCTGGGNLTIQGNPTTPGNCIVSTTSANCFIVTATNVPVTLDGFKLQTTTSGDCIQVNKSGFVQYKNIEFGACAGYHVHALSNGQAVVMGNCTISGNALCHFTAETGGQIYNSAVITITLTGTPAFNIFAYAFRMGYLRLIYSQMTYTGSATGIRASANLNSVVDTGNVAATMPGNSANVIATGGQIV